MNTPIECWAVVNPDGVHVAVWTKKEHAESMKDQLQRDRGRPYSRPYRVVRMVDIDALDEFRDDPPMMPMEVTHRHKRKRVDAPAPPPGHAVCACGDIVPTTCTGCLAEIDAAPWTPKGGEWVRHSPSGHIGKVVHVYASDRTVVYVGRDGREWPAFNDNLEPCDPPGEQPPRHYGKDLACLLCGRIAASDGYSARESDQALICGGCDNTRPIKGSIDEVLL